LLDELAHQKWSGDRIVEEQFYYDPALTQARVVTGSAPGE
jgi:hypothetical protein